jgi:uncharacterized protein YdeI (YjbR/CyaY-like superfamily)
MPGRRKFRGVLEPDGTSLAWTIVRVPFEPVEVWPKRKGLRVRGTIDGVAFRTSLFRGRDGGCVLLVNKLIQKKARVAPGGVAEVVLEPDTQERPRAATPPEFEKLLRRDRALRKWHDALNPSMRSWIAANISEPGSPAARTRRAELWAERLLLAMEGEQETPPILTALFHRHPKARDGWQSMTPIQRRSHLLGIFYCQSPESRQKRAERAIDAALLALERKSRSGRSRSSESGVPD